MIRFLLPISICCTLAGCAGSTHQQIPYTPIPLGSDQDSLREARVAREANAASDSAWDADGIRYYGNSYYLLVYADGRGGINWRLLELPDQTKLMMIHPYNMAAQYRTTLKFRNGTLSGSAEQADTTAVPRAILDALAKAIPAAAKLLMVSGDAERDRYVVHLYKVVVHDGEIQFNGGPGDSDIRVTFVQAPEKEGK